MAKEIKFSVKLDIDGQERLVTATTSTVALRNALHDAKDGATRLRDTLITFNQTVDVLRTAQDAVGQLANTLNSITEESGHFAEAMAAANTMAGKSGAEFDALTDKVAKLATEIPIARDLLANGLYQTISNGVPEDNWVAFLERRAESQLERFADKFMR